MKTNLILQPWLNRNARKYLVFSGLDYLSRATVSATYVLFLLSHGANLWQASLVNIFFMFTIIFTEVPTGAFADHFGRRISLGLGGLIETGGLALYFLAGHFWFFVAAEITVGIGRTFISGALDAWLVDTLHHEKKEWLKPVVFRQKQIFEAAGLAAGGWLGAWLGTSDLAWPWLLAAALSIASTLYSLSFREIYREKMETKPFQRAQATLAWRACRQGLNNKSLVYVMIFGAILAFSLQAINMQWTKFFQSEYELPVSSLAWVIFGIALAKGISGPLSKLASKLTKGEFKPLVATQAVTATAIIGAAQSTGFGLAFSAFFIHEIGREMFAPLKQNYLSDRLDAANRATILSLDSMLSKIGCLVGLALGGWLANSYSIRLAWLFSGILLLVSSLVFLRRKKETN